MNFKNDGQGLGYRILVREGKGTIKVRGALASGPRQWGLCRAEGEAR